MKKMREKAQEARRGENGFLLFVIEAKRERVIEKEKWERAVDINESPFGEKLTRFHCGVKMSSNDTSCPCRHYLKSENGLVTG